MRVSIRSAAVADVPAILPMVEGVCAFHDALDPRLYDYLPDVVDRYRGWLGTRAKDPESVLLVAEVANEQPARSVAAPDTKLVGFLVGEVVDNIPIYRTSRYGFVHDLWVEPAWRRRGVARALVIEALRRFERMGVKQVRAETAAGGTMGGAAGGNEHARSMLRDLGFAHASIEMVRHFS